MAVPRSKAERERDRLKVSELYLQGLTQSEIAAELGISRQTVNSDIKYLLAEWQKRRDGIVDEFEAKYRYIYREAISAWRDSRKNKEVQVQESVESGDGGDGEESGGNSRVKVQLRTEGQSGNPALLGQAQAALKAIREMLGVDKPVKQEISGEVTVNDSLTDEDRARRILALLDRARERRANLSPGGDEPG